SFTTTVGGTPPASLQSRPELQQKETKPGKSGSHKLTWPFVLFVVSCSLLLNPVNPVNAVRFSFPAFPPRRAGSGLPIQICVNQRISLFCSMFCSRDEKGM